MIVNMPKYIIDNVPMRSVAEYYGFELSRGGRIKCPFHDDRNPSMKIYEGNRGYYCFVCKRGGNVINFVSELFNIEKRDAMLKINEDFHLGIVCEKPTKEVKMNAYRQKLKAVSELEQLDAYRAEYRAKCAEYRQIGEISKPTPNTPYEDLTAYFKALWRREYLDCWFRLNEWR